MPQVLEDERGFWAEIYRRDAFAALGLPTDFIQKNHSGSTKGVLRGLHFQWNPPLGDNPLFYNIQTFAAIAKGKTKMMLDGSQ